MTGCSIINPKAQSVLSVQNPNKNSQYALICFYLVLVRLAVHVVFSFHSLSLVTIIFSYALATLSVSVIQDIVSFKDTESCIV